MRDPTSIFAPIPPSSKPTLPHHWIGPPNFTPSIYFTTRLAQKLGKTIDAA
jgi:hypothetical protein